MSNLIRQLAEHYPDWRAHHATPEEAAVEVGLIEPADYDPGYVELDFNDDDLTEFETAETDYD